MSTSDGRRPPAAGVIAEQAAPSARRARSLSWLLAAAERALSAELEDALRLAGYADIRSAHAQVFAAIDAEGSRLTTLAIRAGMTKQAMGELVRHLERHGYLTIEPDRRDRRAKIIRLTESGRPARAHSVTLLERVDRRLIERFGERGAVDLRERLRDLAEGDPARVDQPGG